MVLRSNGFLLLSAILLLAGCGDGRDVGREQLEEMVGSELKETVPVSGIVTIDGAPADRVYLYAYTKESGMKPAAETNTGPDGTYVWSTYEAGDGLVPGQYRLAFAHIPKEGKGKKAGEDLLQGKYTNPLENEFILEVKSGEPQTDVNYELEK